MRKVAVLVAGLALVALAPTTFAAMPGRDGLIAYADDGSGAWRIAVARADGSHAHLVRGLPHGATWPTWSPDGRWIAFNAPGDHDVLQLWIARPDGSHLRELTHDSVGSFTSSWSADGRALVTARDAVNNDAWDAVGELVVVPLQGAERVVLRSEQDIFRPSWSPSGRVIVFSVGEDIWDPNTDADVAEGRLETVHPDGSGLAVVGYGECPDFSPDGKLITYDLPSPEQTGLSQVHVMAADGSHDRVLTKEGWYGAYPAFAPDGRSVLFEATARAHAPAHLYRVSLAGGRLQQLTGGGSNQATVAEQALR